MQDSDHLAVAVNASASVLAEAREVAAARALCRIHALECNVNEGDCWALYGEDFRRNARVMLAAADGAHVVDSDYKRMFGAAVASLAEISEALGIDEEEAACANGNELILAAIARKNEALLAAAKRAAP